MGDEEGPTIQEIELPQHDVKLISVPPGEDGKTRTQLSFTEKSGTVTVMLDVKAKDMKAVEAAAKAMGSLVGGMVDLFLAENDKEPTKKAWEELCDEHGCKQLKPLFAKAKHPIPRQDDYAPGPEDAMAPMMAAPMTPMAPMPALTGAVDDHHEDEHLHEEVHEVVSEARVEPTQPDSRRRRDALTRWLSRALGSPRAGRRRCRRRCRRKCRRRRTTRSRRSWRQWPTAAPT